MHLVLWSGGLDSTAILLYYLKEKIPFETVYINLDNNRVKAKEEKKARKKILKALENYYAVKITDHEVKFSSINFSHKHTLAQPLIWMFGLLQVIHENIDTVNLGYVEGDCFWHIKHNFERAFWHLKRVMDNKFKKFPTLHYPFEWFGKKDLVDYHYSDEIGKYVFGMLWVCEDVMEDSSQCGKCTPCTRFKEIDKYFKKKRGRNK